MKLSEITNYRLEASAKGTACGEFIATLERGDGDRETIKRAAIAFVNHLPLNDMALEDTLRAIFIGAALMALGPAKEAK